jgi:hypothetical protein
MRTSKSICQSIVKKVTSEAINTLQNLMDHKIENDLQKDAGLL